MNTTIFAFASDLQDEGVDQVLDNVQHRAGLGGVTLHTVYHAARDVFPHNPRRRVVHIGAGEVYFQPQPERYEHLRIKPAVSARVAHGDILAELCAASAARGLSTDAFVVYLHPDREYLDCAPRNAFGDPYPTDLCPSNPDVRSYVRALSADLARYDISRIIAESLTFHGLEHGFHHERYAITLSQLTRFLLGLCFCDHCRAVADRHGVDTRRLHAFVRSELEKAFAAPTASELDEEVSREALHAFAAGELAGYLDARCKTVTSLVSEVSEVVAENGTRLAFIDFSGGVKGYVSGSPEGAPAATTAWQFGIDLDRIKTVCPEVVVLGYAADPDRVRLDLEVYVEQLGDGFTVVLRPMLPDCRSPENLAEKVRHVRDLGIERLAFHHYGLMRLQGLDWIREALRPE
jgi:hypothetical protein